MAAECGPRIAIVLSLTANFGLRCSEALCLKREDIGILLWEVITMFLDLFS